MKKIIMKMSLSAIAALLMTSCMVTHTNVGDYRENDGRSYTYAKGKQIYIFGLFRFGSTSVATPANKNCQVVTSINFGDFIISCLTVGIIRSQTIKVMAKMEKGNMPPDNSKSVDIVAAQIQNPATEFIIGDRVSWQGLLDKRTGVILSKKDNYAVVKYSDSQRTQKFPYKQLTKIK